MSTETACRWCAQETTGRCRCNPRCKVAECPECRLLRLARNDGDAEAGRLLESRRTLT